MAHPAFNDAMRTAVRKVAEHVDYDHNYVVYFDGKAAFVREAGSEAPPNSEVICIAQRWNGDTIQLRFAGARSEWVKS
jgi:hypothetical protein